MLSWQGNVSFLRQGKIILFIHNKNHIRVPCPKFSHQGECEWKSNVMGHWEVMGSWGTSFTNGLLPWIAKWAITRWGLIEGHGGYDFKWLSCAQPFPVSIISLYLALLYHTLLPWCSVSPPPRNSRANHGLTPGPKINNPSSKVVFLRYVFTVKSPFFWHL
jgi:hypothetical protein